MIMARSELGIGLCTYHRVRKLSVSIALELRRPAQFFGCYVALTTGAKFIYQPRCELPNTEEP